MLGPTGSGVLWGRRELLDAMPPFMAGGDMIREVKLRRSEFNDVPWKFEAGTPDISAAIGLGVAADYLRGLGMDRVREHERALVAYALETLAREVPGIALYGPPADVRGGVVPFNLPDIHPHDVAQILDRQGICIRAGHHCTMPLHERLDLAATGRASFSVFTTRRHRRAGRRPAEVQRVFGGRRARRLRAAPSGRVARSRDRRFALDCRSMDDLYRDYILEHYRRPHNFGILEDPDALFEGANPLCGDRITVMLGIRDGVVSEVAFTGRGCAISQASASLLTDEIKGKPVAEVESMTPDDVLDLLGIEISPARLKCALLSLDTVSHALEERAKAEGACARAAPAPGASAQASATPEP